MNNHNIQYNNVRLFPQISVQIIIFFKQHNNIVGTVKKCITTIIILLLIHYNRFFVVRVFFMSKLDVFLIYSFSVA